MVSYANDMLWGIKIWQIIIAIILFPFLLGIGAVALRALEDRDFQPRNIKQETIDQRKIDNQKLTPARNLVGTWRGTAKYKFNQTPQSYCYVFFDVALKIDSQANNRIDGSVDVAWLRSEQHGNFPCAQVPDRTDGVTGTVSGSRLKFGGGQQGEFDGSFTTDTVTLNQPKDEAGDGVEGPINLLRQ